jgi:hypothetical protein
MLENQLLLAIVFKQHGVLVERPYFACEFNSADQVYRDRSLIFPDRIEKRVLDVLCRLIVHVPISNSYHVEFALWKMLKLLQRLQSSALSRNALKFCYTKFTRLAGLRLDPTRVKREKASTPPFAQR